MKAVTRPRAKRGEGDRLRDDLLGATIDLVAETGAIDEVSLRGVAKRAGVSPTAVYQHFDDRDTLLEAAVAHAWELFQDAVDMHLGTEDPAAMLRAVGDRYLRFAVDQPGVYAVLFSSRGDLPERTAPVGMSAFDVLVALIAEILDANGDDRDPSFVALQVHSWIHGLASLVACAPDMPWPSRDELLDDLVHRLGLTRPPA